MKYVLIAMLFLISACTIAPQTQEANVDLNLECQLDSDCTAYISLNTCREYCGNMDISNEEEISQLERTCDAGLWDRTFIRCGCVEGICQQLT